MLFAVALFLVRARRSDSGADHRVDSLPRSDSDGIHKRPYAKVSMLLKEPARNEGEMRERPSTWIWVYVKEPQVVKINPQPRTLYGFPRCHIVELQN